MRAERDLTGEGPRAEALSGEALPGEGRPDDALPGREHLPDGRTPRGAGREYRIGELAEAAGLPVRTLRYYQERKLLPPPRRTGRIGLYSEEHLARLRMIASLLERGHTLEGIRELLSAWEQGRDIRSVLGVERAVTDPWSHEVPVTMTYDELAALFPGQVTRERLRAVAEAGLLDVDGDRITHWSRRHLEASVAFVRAGVPLEEVLAAGVELRRRLDELAALFVRLTSEYVVGGPAGKDPGELADTLALLRPGAQVAVEAGFAAAMDRQVRAEIDRVLGGLAAHPD
ncbi:MerR family transcriptional regulator [Actinomadura rupiterrae]|uniref:MerR family transcriptional regulator n=1 Tax=Actinomadura rupiterrae TaxID=559627 RepID=UPI0020A50C13|nr:MerR family transcriptional regulator [Actinomadura rupiterrae]MCP2340441.1 DNA-binding transcriptional MerR regulator [Actinomadura rupiterrae]